MGLRVRLPFEGNNEVYSIYGWRDLDGKPSNGLENWHGGWDIRKPKVCGTVPTEAADCPMSGKVDWRQNFNAKTSANDSTSYGNAVRIYNEWADLRVICAHASALAVSYADAVPVGQTIGVWGPNTTGNSGGVHLHLEFRKGGTKTACRICPGDALGIANEKDVIYNRDAMEVAAIGLLDVEKDGYRWREGPGTSNPLWLDENNRAVHYCIKGVEYLVYAMEVDENTGDIWYQITPPQSCISYGYAPALWVHGDCGRFAPKPDVVVTDEATDTAQMFDCNVMILPETQTQAAEIAAKAVALELPFYFAVSGGDKVALAALADSLGVKHEEV